MSKKEWFASWFDTPYYHTLYQTRNEEEAKKFINRLIQFLDLPKKSVVLDLACGKGRHSRTLEALEMQVLGVDLSFESIACAKLFESPTLQFQVHDMREIIPNRTFDAIFNLFTSFGYFDDDCENETVLKGVVSMLHPEGVFVFDYLNVVSTIQKLVPEENKIIDGLKFDIQRHFDGRYIRKKIDVVDQDKSFQFEEKVRGFSHDDMLTMLHKVGLKTTHTFGDFELNPYNEKESDRMILICKKNI